MTGMVTADPIKAYREANNISQEDFAKLLGVTVATVSRWENRKRTPRGGDLQKLCSITGIPAAEILGVAEAAE